MRRLCIFSFYDGQGIVDDYVVYFLNELGKHVEKIIFYSNGPLSRDSEIALRGVVGRSDFEAECGLRRACLQRGAGEDKV